MGIQKFLMKWGAGHGATKRVSQQSIQFSDTSAGSGQNISTLSADFVSPGLQQRRCEQCSKVLLVDD